MYVHHKSQDCPISMSVTDNAHTHMSQSAVLSQEVPACQFQIHPLWVFVCFQAKHIEQTDSKKNSWHPFFLFFSSCPFHLPFFHFLLHPLLLPVTSSLHFLFSPFLPVFWSFLFSVITLSHVPFAPFLFSCSVFTDFNRFVVCLFF